MIYAIFRTIFTCNTLYNYFFDIIEIIREVKLIAVLITANPRSSQATNFSGFLFEGFRSNLIQKMAGMKKQMSGLIVDPISPRTNSRGGLMQAMSQVSKSMPVVVA